MFVIIEGSDCAGKSTFAQRLQNELKHADPNATVVYRHAGPPVGHAINEYVEPFLSYRPEQNTHVICDRLHIGERVYPRVLDRPTTQTAAVRAYVELFLRSRGAFLVYCQALPDHLRRCGEARGDDAATIDLIPATLREFDRAVATSLLPHMVVNVSDPDGDTAALAVEHVISLANDEAWYAQKLNDLVTYVGPTRPKLLLFGDRRGPATVDLADYGDLPAFVPHVGTSGRYLLDVLTRWPLRVPEHGLLLRDIGIANACDVDDPRAVWEAVGRPEAVALGRNAARALTDAKVPHRYANHPQYARRFHHNGFEDYLHQLLEIGVHA